MPTQVLGGKRLKAHGCCHLKYYGWEAAVLLGHTQIAPRLLDVILFSYSMICIKVTQILCRFALQCCFDLSLSARTVAHVTCHKLTVLNAL